APGRPGAVPRSRPAPASPGGRAVAETSPPPWHRRGPARPRRIPPIPAPVPALPPPGPGPLPFSPPGARRPGAHRDAAGARAAVETSPALSRLSGVRSGARGARPGPPALPALLPVDAGDTGRPGPLTGTGTADRDRPVERRRVNGAAEGKTQAIAPAGTTAPRRRTAAHRRGRPPAPGRIPDSPAGDERRCGRSPLRPARRPVLRGADPRFPGRAPGPGRTPGLRRKTGAGTGAAPRAAVSTRPTGGRERGSELGARASRPERARPRRAAGPVPGGRFRRRRAAGPVSR